MRPELSISIISRILHIELNNDVLAQHDQWQWENFLEYNFSVL